MTFKINNTRSPEIFNRERDIEEHIAQQDPSHPGHMFNRTWLESFVVEGPEGNHLCLAYEPMREPLWILPYRFVSQKVPLSIAKAYIRAIPFGLDYLHAEYKVVHTDLKLDNILLAIESEKILSDFVEEHTTKVSMGYKTNPTTGRTVYRCKKDLGP